MKKLGVVYTKHILVDICLHPIPRPCKAVHTSHHFLCFQMVVLNVVLSTGFKVFIIMLIFLHFVKISSSCFKYVRRYKINQKVMTKCFSSISASTINPTSAVLLTSQTGRGGISSANLIRKVSFAKYYQFFCQCQSKVPDDATLVPEIFDKNRLPN